MWEEVSGSAGAGFVSSEIAIPPIQQFDLVGTSYSFVPCSQPFFHTLQKELAPNQVKVSVKIIATATRTKVVWPTR